MSLSPGTKLIHYEIVEPIGKGGMGEVYHARDTKLGRDVAIKVLPDELAKDRERLARFEREAKLLASLNHPAIATLHGFEDGFIIMELVEGETLAERIAGGPIPVDEAIPLFSQIAEGLEAAHEKGVIHRDLKPANIKITSEGQIKILDFGLAKAFLPDEDVSAETSQSPTLTKGTALGAIMGTAAYMSPEQARGHAVDRRTDIWAFGCCLYEALTGKKAFVGDNVTDVLAAVVRAEPDLDVLEGKASGTVRRTLAQCLEKDRKQRFQHIGDVRIALTAKPDFEPVARPSRSSTAVVSGVALVSAMVAGLLVWMIGARSEPPSHVVRSTINLPPGQELMHFGTMTLSPDGTLLAYTAMESASTHLYLRRFDEFESSRIPGTEGAKDMVFFSPDGGWVGYSTWTGLKKVPVSGGASVALVDAIDPTGATWTEDGWIVYNPGQLRGLERVPSEGGTTETLTTLDEAYGDSAHVWPQSLPGDHRLLLFYTWGDAPAPALVNFDTSAVVRLEIAGSKGVVYVPTGHLVYGIQSASSYGVASSWDLVAVRFDLGRQQMEGAPQTVIRGVYGFEEPLFTISANGALAYVPFSGGKTKLVWVDRRGRETAVRGDLPMATPRLAPDGRSIVGERAKRLWSLDEKRGVSVPLTDAPPAASFVSPVWSPDGASVTGQFNRPGHHWDLYEIPVDGSAAPRLLMESRASEDARPGSWSPDGNRLVFVRAYDLWVFRRDGEPEPFLQTPALERSPRFSPNGRFIAYASDVSGREEVYIRPYAESGRAILVSSDGGKEPVWSRDGRELFYRRDRQLLAVPVETTDELRVGEPEVLYEGRYLYSAIGWSFPHYDVSLDGQRFLMVKEDEQLARDKIRIVQNWFDELERLMSTEN